MSSVTIRDDIDDDEFGDLNFVSSAARKNQEIYKSTSLEPEIENNHDSNDGFSFDNQIQVEKQKEKPASETEVHIVSGNSESDITPPSSPTNESTRSFKNSRGIRGGKRSAKTKAALQKLQVAHISRKNRGAETVVYISDEEGNDSDDEIIVKLRWKYEVKRMKLKRSERLGNLFDRFVQDEANKEPTPLEFRLGDRVLKRSDTAEQLHLDVTSIIQVRPGKRLPVEDAMIELKFQTEDRRKTVTLKVGREEKMKILMQRYSEMTGNTVRKLILDGEEIDPEETSETLDFEGGESVDVYC